MSGFAGAESDECVDESGNLKPLCVFADSRQTTMPTALPPCPALQTNKRSKALPSTPATAFT